MNKTEGKYSMGYKIKELEKRGFTHMRIGMTNGKYAFIYYQIDSDTMSDEEWEGYIRDLDNEAQNNKPPEKTLLELQAEIRQANKLEYLRKLKLRNHGQKKRN